TLSQTRKTTVGGVGPVSTDNGYSGLEFGLGAGVSIPAGPLRIVPKAGLAFGQFTSQNCKLPTGTSLPSASLPAATACSASSDVTDTGLHTVLSLAVGLYYNIDLSKKSASASAAPVRRTAGVD